MKVILRATTVGDLGDVSVGCGTVGDVGPYPLPDGRIATGPTAVLAPFDRDERVVVGLGSEIEVGGSRWRVVAIDAGDRAAAPLHGAGGRNGGAVTLQRLDGGPMIDGIDFGTVDLTELVARQLRHGFVGNTLPDDRTPLDWLKRTYRLLQAEHPAIAAALARAVGASLPSGSPKVDGLVIRFYADLPHAPGGERLWEVVLEEPRQFRGDAPDPTSGSLADTLRESLLRAALQWRDGADLPRGVLDAAREAIRRGEGRFLIFDVARRDPVWTRRALPSIASMYPDASNSIFRALTLAGVAPDAALASVLPHANDRGKRLLADAIQWDYRDDAVLCERLLAQVG